jgi:hypothetical protein
LIEDSGFVRIDQREPFNLQSSIFNLKYFGVDRPMPTVDDLKRRYEDLHKRAADLRSYL